MMLRASVEQNGGVADLGAVVGAPNRAEPEVESDEPPVPAARELVAFAEAMVSGDETAQKLARAELIEAVGPAGFVDAAGVVGNFQRMVRIADGTGIPLEPPVMALTADFRENLGLNAFATAQRSKEVGSVARALGRMGRPLMGPLLALIAKVVGPRQP